MPNEIELKLKVRPAQLTRLAGARWLTRLASGAGENSRSVSVYYDTDDLSLREQGATLRVRECKGVFTQNFKAQSTSGESALGRLEWDCVIRGRRPDLKHAAKKKTAGVDLKKLAGALKPVFETNVHRRTVPLRYRGSQIELALDHGEIRTGRRRAPIHEIELELKRGDPASVIILGRQIAQKLKAAYGVASKSERGYALRENKAGCPVSGVGIKLSRDWTAGQAFQATAMSCVHHFAGNEEAVLAGKSEGVHQMRVGLRRLRAAISVFKDVLRGSETEAIKGSLKWLTEELGSARDMDVMAKDAFGPLAKATPAPKGIAALKANIVAKRGKGFAQAKRAVASDRYRRVVLSTVLWINGGRWTKSRSAPIALRRGQATERYAKQELERRSQKVLKELAKLSELSPLKRHKLRIAVKKLRYATGFFESLFDEEKAVKKFAAVLEDLQSSLGQLNDIRVHGLLAKEFAAPGRGTRRAAGEAFAMGELTGEERAKSRKLLKAAIRRGKRLKRCASFWE